MWPWGRKAKQAACGHGHDGEADLGPRGEKLAAQFLKKQGLKVLARNYRCPAGEADIIVAKHRNGQTRTIPVAFQGHLSRFANMARDVSVEPAYE